MTKGVLCFASNNEKVNYLKQAINLANRVKQYLDLPTTIVTRDTQFLEKTYPDHPFDKVILDESVNLRKNFKQYHNGTLHREPLEFRNNSRVNAYQLTPYDSTLVLDTDVLLANDNFLHCFDDSEFKIYDTCKDVSQWRNNPEFTYINDSGIKFYWATAFYFTKKHKIFFDLLRHIADEWDYYRVSFDLNTNTFRNDHIFSIAIHIMNDYQTGSWAKPMPGTLWYSLDRDFIFDIDRDKFSLLIEKPGYLGEYIVAKLHKQNIHCMNKFSLNEVLDD